MVLKCNLSELALAATKFCEEIGDTRVFLFNGEMGAGKTTFIKEICKCLGVTDEVTSPTFAIINEYPCRKYNFIYHFDFYRIEKTAEIFDIGFEEYLETDSLLFIEWPDKAEELIRFDSKVVSIVQMQDDRRQISW